MSRLFFFKQKIKIDLPKKKNHKKGVIFYFAPATMMLKMALLFHSPISVATSINNSSIKDLRDASNIRNYL